jgi:hypothetical protein
MAALKFQHNKKLIDIENILSSSLQYFTNDSNFVVGTFLEKSGFSSDTERFIFAGIVIRSQGVSKSQYYL